MKTKGKVARALEDLKLNHNFSIWQEIVDRNQNNMGLTAIEYRGNKISYFEMLSEVDTYALALTSLGYKKGDEIVVCASNTPEFIYLFLACSKKGMKINCIAEWFDKDYIEEIIEKSKTRHIFVTDDLYGHIKKTIERTPINDVIMFSLHDSLPFIYDGQKDPYKEIDEKFKNFDNVTWKYDDGEKNIITTRKFKIMGYKYGVYTLGLERTTDALRNACIAPVSLDDDFTITYSSGTTGRPKGILHKVKSYMTISRFKDADVSGMPKMRNVKTLFHIPNYVHASLTTSISDPLFQKSSIMVEPIYDINHFPYSIIINKPNYICAGSGYWINLAKNLSNNPSFANVKMPYLFMPFVTGERMSPGEEKFLNEVAKKHKFGIWKLKVMSAPFSIGGGTSESSGIFVTLYKKLMETVTRKEVGLKPLACADVKIIDEEGNECKTGEYGSMIISGNCNMAKYYYDPELSEKTKHVTEDGRVWLKMDAYGVKLGENNFQIKGRIKDTIILSNGEKYPFFKIQDIVELDTKNIMSCAIAEVRVGDGVDYVVHIEKQPNIRIDEQKLLESVVQRLDSIGIPEEIKDSLYFRVRTNEESFYVASSGKRSITALQKEGLSFAHSYNNIKKNEKSLLYK